MNIRQGPHSFYTPRITRKTQHFHKNQSKNSNWEEDETGEIYRMKTFRSHRYLSTKAHKLHAGTTITAHPVTLQEVKEHLQYKHNDFQTLNNCFQLKKLNLLRVIKKLHQHGKDCHLYRCANELFEKTMMTYNELKNSKHTRYIVLYKNEWVSSQTCYIQQVMDKHHQQMIKLCCERELQVFDKMKCSICEKKIYDCIRRQRRKTKTTQTNKTTPTTQAISYILWLPMEIIHIICEQATNRTIYNFYIAATKHLRQGIITHIEKKRPKLMTTEIITMYKSIDEANSNYYICQKCNIINFPDKLSCTNCKTTRQHNQFETVKIEQTYNKFFAPIHKVTTTKYTPYFMTCMELNCDIIIKCTPKSTSQFFTSEHLKDGKILKIGNYTSPTEQQILCFQHKDCSIEPWN